MILKVFHKVKMASLFNFSVSSSKTLRVRESMGKLSWPLIGMVPSASC